MAELTPQERLQPALLDRLTDEDPSRSQEPREARVMSRQRLRQAVLRDLAWLFNAARPSDIDWEIYPEAEHSVINFGLPALSGSLASSLDVAALENSIRQAIVDFEPRITPSTLQVEALVSDLQLDHHNVVSVQIRGTLWAQPVPIELLLRTEVDLETGEVEIRELS
jgi:type VI secretion system protein ImpF